MSEADPEITALLHRWREGDSAAEARLIELTYDELRRIARAQLRRDRPDHTLQPTALVHEAYARMLGLRIDWQDRVHFLSMAARSMRRVLVDEARKRKADKRGGGERPLTIDTNVVDSVEGQPDLLDLDRALEALAEDSPRAAQAVELHYFGGLTHPDLAKALDISEATVLRDLRFARAFLRARMTADSDTRTGGETP